ncbi:MAG: hypothetical protein F4X59_12620 [Holophagales bacterium]|nr:hypothetical protein [Holophagales bacterium]MYC10959.1 hypothetical protein [Holophagales bacterium]
MSALEIIALPWTIVLELIDRIRESAANKQWGMVAVWLTVVFLYAILVLAVVWLLGVRVMIAYIQTAVAECPPTD